MTDTPSPAKGGAPLRDPAHLHALVVRIFTRLGSSAADAATLADMLIWSHLTGRDGHGVVRVPWYAQMARSGELDPKGQLTVERELPATLLLDANRAAGPIAMVAATDRAVARARTQGGCFAMVRRTTHTGAIGYYALRAAEAGLAALVICSGKPIMAYHGAKVASLPTGPIAIAVPGGPSGPLLLDMATSIASFGRLRQLAARDAEIPEGWALDKDGQPTTRARDGVIPLPLGGPKGSGLALMFEALTGMLSGAPVLVPTLADPDGPGRGSSALIMVMDPAAFGAPEAFADEVEALRAAIKALPRQDGVEDILLPGERSKALMATRLREGVPVPDALMADLAALAG
ncbi:Ldh family oxidoreductase [Aquabacter spiritensis]|uniref:Ureidoglycolate dehydrogenase (NAD+) n=1 Tax=Aquabacter spiritensis TaxID=933073 RepID=A0A4R3M5Z1_9HYPH|nr:Ldh family oxidoreductase [Aquabacter spiritensis]TCT06665.1 ureidoglycolate dehydrogenase (NAD+) [Aquabacter spiritensis]